MNTSVVTKITNKEILTQDVAIPALSVVEAEKVFGSVMALDSVSIEAHRGQVLALLGDNGAGKSTLIKCISGVHALDSGEIRVDGKLAAIRNSRDARNVGIETVYQDLALFDNLSSSQNFYAGRELSFPNWLPRSLRFLRSQKMRSTTQEALNNLQVTLPDIDAVVALMSGGQRQAVAVARAAFFASKVVILDEPTAALGLRESKEVINLIARLRDAGNAIILITHNMEQVVELANKAVVLRRGQMVGELIPTRDNQQQLISMIVGA